ncbi:inositol-tetrakisphosphate 1-kinase 1-like [Prunus avium]|uniref:Inositol-tetrakisphosphate 1-kinase n=1 Tax=Prunus avium TaxID=42229 RepID=A0A6P5SRE5_PRUAV|nr:inositol-tetrakisphosphate 1-kinase 1-like [Prunus avium]
MKISSSDAAAGQRFRIGYAFAPKKEQSFIQPSLLDHASQNGIDFVPISITDSLSEEEAAEALIQQGPFHCIIHKLYGHRWNHQLKQYSSKYPQTLILDPPDSIERLHNRVSMLQVVSALKLNSQFNISVSVPKQVVLQNPQSPDSIHNNTIDGAVEFPVIAKPLLANGSAKSHEMCLVFDPKGLQTLLLTTTTTTTTSASTQPILLQQFVNHGEVVFKVYVIGEYVQCVKRSSLPDISEQQLTALEGQVLPFSQISNSPQPQEGDEHGLGLAHDPHEMPPSDFVEELARGIRLGLKLNFFNFDVIRDSGNPHSYFVIDINYFPGYAKLPSYEQMLTNFLLALLNTPTQKDHQLEPATTEEEEESDHDHLGDRGGGGDASLLP